jgi:hypothetical protein
MDKQGRILFIFSRQPYAMPDFNARLLALPLDITNAMHVEGGPEASLSIHGGGIDLDLNGSYDLSFNEETDGPQQWPIPNVLGVARKVSAQGPAPTSSSRCDKRHDGAGAAKAPIAPKM